MKPERPFLVYAIILLVHLLYFFYGVFRPPVSLPDAGDYLNASHHLFGQGILYCGDLSEPIREELFTRRPPLYPILLVIQTLTGSENLVFLFQIILSMLSIIMVFRIFAPDSRDQKPFFHVAALVLILATPAQFIYSSRIMAEIPFQLLIVLSVWSLFKHLKTQEKKYIWLFHLFLTLGMATKPVLYPFAAVSLVFSLYMFLVTRKRAWILALCLPLIWIGGYRYWNYQRTGSTQYSSIQTANLINYNLRYFITSREGPAVAVTEVDRLYDRCAQTDSYREKNLCLEWGAREIIRTRMSEYILFHLKGSVRYFIDPGRFDLVTFFRTGQSNGPGFLDAVHKHGIRGAFRFLGQQGPGLIFVLVLIGFFKLVKVTGFVYYLFRRQQPLHLRIFLFLLVGYMAVVTGPLGASRFLLPVELLIIGGAVRGWTAILKPTSRGSGKVHPGQVKG